MNKFIITSLLALSGTLINSEVVNSAIINGSFNVNVETGALAGTELPGFFKYDDSSLTGIGRESIGNGLGFFEFEFQWFGVTYREDSNPEFASRIEFHNGNFLGIRYFLGWDKPTPNFSLSLSSFSYENNPDILDAQGSVSYTMTSVPESNSVITLLGFGFFGVRVIANQRFTAKSE